MTRHRLLLPALLALLPALYFFPAVSGQVTLAPGDGWAYHFGMRALIGQMLASGTLPLWNPYIFGGMPLLACIEPGALYPVNWLFALLPPAIAFNVAVLSTHYLALVGTYLFARQLGQTRFGALIAGISFSFGGYLIAHLGNLNLAAPAAWLPWLLLAIERSKSNDHWWRWVVLGAAFIALQCFAGHPQITLYVALVAGAWSLFTLWHNDEADISRGAFALRIAAMLVAGVLLALAQLLPAWELGKAGERAALSYEYFSTESLPPRQLLTMLFPYFFGGATDPARHTIHWGEQPWFFGATSIFKYQVTYWGAWGNTYMLGYVGMPGLLLSLIALIGAGRNRHVRFWAMLAMVALLLSLGSYLPFELNRVLYRLPGYNLMRCSYRHLFEFTFAAALLAGFGVSYLSQQKWKHTQQTLTIAAGLLALLILVIAGLYRFSPKAFVTGVTPPINAGAFAAPELWLPLLFFAFSVAALWWYAQRLNAMSAALLLLILFIDLTSLTQFGEWRGSNNSSPNAATRLTDAPALQFIKAREADLNSFRIVSHSPWPYGENYDALNFPNLSAARGVQSLNGYNAFRLNRTAAMAGRLGIEGLINDPTAFDTQHQGLNLLNVKYLLQEKLNGQKNWPALNMDGIRFSIAPLGAALGDRILLKPRATLTLEADNINADELALVTTMVGGATLADDTPLVAIKLHTNDGQSFTHELKVGRDTAEWDHDRLVPNAQHTRARIAESWQIEAHSSFVGHRYFTRLKFKRAAIARIEFSYLADRAELYLVRASLFDSINQLSAPLNALALPPERWQKLQRFGDIEVYENRQPLPRAWFMRETIALNDEASLRAINSGQLPDGNRFDPLKTALISEGASNSSINSSISSSGLSTGEVRVVSYAANHLELATQNAAAGFLVLSEIDYPGWLALIDGTPTTIQRTNYNLRGVAVPPGNHRVEFTYRPKSFDYGLFGSGAGVVLLLIGAFIRYKSESV